MAEPSPQKPPVPRWAWFFAGACFVIPILTLGGAIPAAIGGFSGAGVLAIARQTGKPTRRRVIHCGVITGSAWTVFVVFLISWTALQVRFPGLDTHAKRGKPKAENMVASHSPAVDATKPVETELTEEKQRKIYVMAMRTRSHIEFAEELGSSDEHIERLEKMHEKRLEFATRFYKITRERLDEIIDEGTLNNWPTE